MPKERYREREGEKLGEKWKENLDSVIRYVYYILLFYA